MKNDCIFYTTKETNGNINSHYEYVLKENLEARKKEISEMENFLEFNMDDGSYKDLPRKQII